MLSNNIPCIPVNPNTSLAFAVLVQRCVISTSCSSREPTLARGTPARMRRRFFLAIFRDVSGVVNAPGNMAVSIRGRQIRSLRMRGELGLCPPEPGPYRGVTVDPDVYLAAFN